MEERANQVAKVLQQLSKAVGELSPEQLAAVEAGRFRIVTVADVNAEPAPRRKTPQLLDQAVLEELTQRLEGMEDADAGLALLKLECPRKNQLEQLARHLCMQVRRGDDLETLRQNIVVWKIGRRRDREGVLGTTRERSTSELPPDRVAESDVPSSSAGQDLESRSPTQMREVAESELPYTRE